jgi:oligoendopeptidase F
MTEKLIEWNLSDFYESIDDTQIKNDLDNLLKVAKKFNSNVKGKLTDPDLTSSQLSNWFKEYEKIGEKAFYLQTYSQLIYSINTLDDEVKAFHAKIEEYMVKIQEMTLFFYLELNQISDSKYEGLIKSPELAKYIHALNYNRLKKPHQLSEREEQIILMKDITGVNGFLKLYSEIKSNFIYDFEIDGEMKKLTESELFAFMYQNDRKLRHKALSKIVSRYKENETIFTHIFNNILKDWDLESKKKNYNTPIARRNLSNEISDESVEVLGKTTINGYRLVEKYYTLKKKILKLEDLRMSDLYAPIGNIEKKYSFEEALRLIEEINENFHPEFSKIIKTMQQKGHIDASPRKGKNRGAFCEFGKLKHYAYVFVNYTENVDSVLTLSHELGHAIHAFYIQDEQNFVNLGISLAIAEIASVFNEMLILDYLLDSDLTKEEKISLLAIFIENNIATSFRQNAFYNFELKIHELIGEKLPNTSEIKDLFVKEIELMFGNSMKNIAEDYANYVFVIPHFLNDPFYVYAYNMSNLLVIALYQIYLEKKEDFVPKFIKLLKVGSSLSPEEMLKLVDIDLSDSSFWGKGIEYLMDKVNELEKLID